MMILVEMCSINHTCIWKYYENCNLAYGLLNVARSFRQLCPRIRSIYLSWLEQSHMYICLLWSSMLLYLSHVLCVDRCFVNDSILVVVWLVFHCTIVCNEDRIFCEMSFLLSLLWLHRQCSLPMFWCLRVWLLFRWSELCLVDIFLLYSRVPSSPFYCSCMMNKMKKFEFIVI